MSVDDDAGWKKTSERERERLDRTIIEIREGTIIERIEVTIIEVTRKRE